MKNDETKSGHYGRVNIGIKKTNGKISTIFLVNKQLNKKGVEVRECRKTKRTNR